MFKSIETNFHKKTVVRRVGRGEIEGGKERR